MDNEFKNFKFENTNNFKFVVIKPSVITDLNFNSHNYVDEILNLSIYEVIISNPETFLIDVTKYLEIKEFNDPDVEVKTQVICDEPNYVYELLYANLINKKNNKSENGVASLINNNNDIIFGPAILLKTYMPSLLSSMLIDQTEIRDIKKILDNRVKIKIVLYEDNKWKEIIVITNKIEEFADDFFDDKYNKLEIPFLLHNINIWYEISDYKNNVCGNLVNHSINKCLWFTMISDEYKGQLTLSEVEKIIELSNHLEYPYKPEPEWIKDENDELGRKIIKNKYKILEKTYYEIITKKF